MFYHEHLSLIRWNKSVTEFAAAFANREGKATTH